MSDLGSIERIITSLNMHLFGNKLPRLKLRVHDAPREATGICWPERNTISLRRDALDFPQAALCRLLCHEMAHAATRNEPEHHGVRWERQMRRCGLDPLTEAIAPYGQLDIWMREHRW